MRYVVALGLLYASNVWPQSVELQDQDVVQFSVPAQQGAVETEIFFSVPDEVSNVLVELKASANSRDIDLFLKPDLPFTSQRSFSLLEESAYRSRSSGGDEYVNIQDFATPAVHGRTWYVGIAAQAGDETTATLSVSFDRGAGPENAFVIDFNNGSNDPDCNTAFWTDSTPIESTRGNPATTLGEARRLAMLRAADIFSSQLSSRVPVRIQACWEDVGGFDGPREGGTLASAGPRTVFADSPGLPQPDTLYVSAPATRLAGTDLCRIDPIVECSRPDIGITFNISAASRYYYGFEPARSGDGTDFISIALHEITHGLGIIDLFREDGSLVFDQFSAYDRQLAFLDEAGRIVTLDEPSVTNAQRAEAFLSFDNLLWADDQANIQEQNTLLSFEAGLIRMNAPPEYDGGSSVGHVSGAYCDLMRPSFGLCKPEALREFGLTRKMLDSLGWLDGRDEAPSTGLFFDTTHQGHGYDLRSAGIGADGEEVFVLTFYTYRTLGGTPEWYQAVGTIKDGAFVGVRNTNGNGMPRYLYDAANNPPQTADPDTYSQVAVSFNNVAKSPACLDDVDRSGAESISSFQWAIGNQAGEWCAEPLVGRSNTPPPELDFGGLWWVGPEDNGWGLTIETIAQDSGQLGIFVLAYVYDAQGSPVWFFGVGEGVEIGAPFTMTLFQRNGYPRIRTNGNLSDTEAGTLILTLVEPSADPGAGNTAALNVSLVSPSVGSWVRDSPIRLLTQPRN